MLCVCILCGGLLKIFTDCSDMLFSLHNNLWLTLISIQLYLTRELICNFNWVPDYDNQVKSGIITDFLFLWKLTHQLKFFTIFCCVVMIRQTGAAWRQLAAIAAHRSEHCNETYRLIRFERRRHLLDILSHKSRQQLYDSSIIIILWHWNHSHIIRMIVSHRSHHKCEKISSVL